MRIVRHKTADGHIAGYTMWLSANDTYNWARKPGAAWPCSTTSDKRFRIEVDSNGLCDLTVNGKSQTDDCVDGHEFDAIVSDFLPKDCNHLWPLWDQTKGESQWLRT